MSVCVFVCVCVCIVQVKWEFGGGCGCPPFLQVTCFTGQHSLIFPRSEAIREEMGPPAIWPSSPSSRPSPPKLPLSSQHPVITPHPAPAPPPSPCVFTVLTIKPWPWVFRGPNWTQCWRWLWWMEGGWSRGSLWTCLSSACTGLLCKKGMEQMDGRTSNCRVLSVENRTAGLLALLSLSLETNQSFQELKWQLSRVCSLFLCGQWPQHTACIQCSFGGYQWQSKIMEKKYINIGLSASASLLCVFPSLF